MAQVTLTDVVKLYPPPARGKPEVRAVDRVSLDIRDGEFVVLVGPSGCGKSTTLRMIAGLEEISAGTVAIGPRVVNDVLPKDRDIAMVFQNYALYPHMTVYDNMAFALKLRKVPKPQIRERVHAAAKTLDIEHLLDRKPKALSGGQRQRVAVGRAIVRDPSVFLFDEPLSNLDAKLRVTTRAELKRLHQRLHTTTVYVTHDQEEAMTLGDRIVVMKDGVIQQAATPLETYQRPLNRFVASFIGMPPMNMFDGTLVEQGARLAFVEGRLVGARKIEQRSDEPEVMEGDRVETPTGGFTVELPSDVPTGLRGYVGKHVVLGVRPEHLHVGEPRGGASARVDAKVTVVEPLGNDMDVYLDTALHGYKVARTEARSDLAAGATLPLWVDARQVHVFEPGPTGRNLTLHGGGAGAG